ncbi:MAG: LytTR family DNA-binding domain-containing protein [Defluviitaleaceae bacterium]|nr:LytTR family DNA-binding domain-containing protein [Defluviitaleaceae bacterium]
MIPVFIYDHDPKELKQLKKIVEDYIMIEDLDMTVFSTSDAYEILDYMESHQVKNGLYFLDINLSQKVNGLALASKIRHSDDYGVIVFVTVQPELMYLTFTYKIEAMDFIVKTRRSEMVTRMRECIQLAHDRMLRLKRDKGKGYRHFYQVKVGGKIKMIPYEDIMFFETSLTPHMLILHLSDQQLEFRGSIKETASDTAFFRCHKSLVVNLRNIESINISKREIELINGTICPLSVKAMRELKLLKNLPVVSNFA